MRYKPVPSPRPVDAIADVRDALPLVPDSVDDCCARLLDRGVVETREQAQQWLPFLVALELAAEADGKYYQRREDVDPDRLAARFRDRVLGVEAVLSALDASAEPQTTAAVFASTRGVVPNWERNRRPDWETAWERRTERVLSWSVRFGLVEAVDGGYRLTR